jgi:hypothetical protein
MSDIKSLREEIPSYAFIALARRGMEKISLDQCFLENCDNKDIDLLEPIKKEEYEDDKKIVKEIHIKCKKCDRIFVLKLETIKKVAKSTKNKDEEALPMGLVYALDEKKNDLGHIGYF